MVRRLLVIAAVTALLVVGACVFSRADVALLVVAGGCFCALWILRLPGVLP